MKLENVQIGMGRIGSKNCLKQQNGKMASDKN